MKGYKSPFNSLVRKAFEHFFSKVKAGCRAGRRTCISCINILVAFAVLFCITPLNIRRKRNVTVTFKPVFVNCKIKLYGTEFSSCITSMFNNCSHSSVREFIMHSGLLLFCTLYHCIPDAAVLIDCVQKHKLTFAAGSFLNSVNAGTADTGIIKNHQSVRGN